MTILRVQGPNLHFPGERQSRLSSTLADLAVGGVRGFGVDSCQSALQAMRQLPAAQASACCPQPPKETP